MRRVEKRFRIGGILVVATTAAGLANLINKSKDSVLRYEKTGILPPAPIIYRGRRYYPLSLCSKLAEIIKEFPPNKPPSAELIQKITILFNTEKSKLCPENQNPQK